MTLAPTTPRPSAPLLIDPLAPLASAEADDPLPPVPPPPPPSLAACAHLTCNRKEMTLSASASSSLVLADGLETIATAAV